MVILDNNIFYAKYIIHRIVYMIIFVSLRKGGKKSIIIHGDTIYITIISWNIYTLFNKKNLFLFQKNVVILTTKNNTTNFKYILSELYCNTG